MATDTVVAVRTSYDKKNAFSAQPKMTLPEKITAGDVTDVQLSPYGEFEQVLPDGRRVVQIVDGEALRNILFNFSARLRPDGILVDADHQSEDGGSTEALAWVEDMRIDPEAGLIGRLRWTDKGAQAVCARRYRFVSPAWELAEDGRPVRLVSVALTNRPNLPVRPILNRAAPRPDAPAYQNGFFHSTATETTNPKPETKMIEEIKTLLGLPPEATDQDVLAAVQALKAKVDEAEAAAAEAKADAEAEAFANDEIAAGALPEEKEVLKRASIPRKIQ